MKTETEYSEKTNNIAETQKNKQIKWQFEHMHEVK